MAVVERLSEIEGRLRMMEITLHNVWILARLERAISSHILHSDTMRSVYGDELLAELRSLCDSLRAGPQEDQTASASSHGGTV